MAKEKPKLPPPNRTSPPPDYTPNSGKTPVKEIFKCVEWPMAVFERDMKEGYKQLTIVASLITLGGFILICSGELRDERLLPYIPVILIGGIVLILGAGMPVFRALHVYLSPEKHFKVITCGGCKFANYTTAVFRCSCELVKPCKRSVFDKCQGEGCEKRPSQVQCKNCEQMIKIWPDSENKDPHLYRV